MDITGAVPPGQQGSCGTQRDSGGGRCHPSFGTLGILGQNTSGAASPWVLCSQWMILGALEGQQAAWGGGWAGWLPAGYLEVTYARCPHPGDGHTALASQLLFLASPWPLQRSHHRRGQQLLPFPFPFPQTRGMDGDRMRNPPSVGSNGAAQSLLGSSLQPRFPPV